MEDMSLDDPASQYMPLGSVFIAIAIAVWTSVAVWLCYSGPPGNEAGDADGDSQSADGNGDLSDGMICRVARGFAELLLEGKDKASTGTQCDARSLDLSKLEELLTPSKSDCKGGAMKKSSKGLLGKVAGSVPGKDGNGHLSTGLAGLSLGRDCEKESGGLCDARAVSSPARASSELEGRGSRTSTSVGVGDDDVGSDKPDFTGFREQLRDKLSSSLSSSGRKYGAMDDLGPVASPARSRLDVSEAEAGTDRTGDRRGGIANAKREALEDFLKQLLHPPGPGLRGDEKLISNSTTAARARGKLPDGADGDEKEVGTRPATMLSMAEHAREIGNKYLQDRHFAGAAHCYEVACLLYPAEVGGRELNTTIGGPSAGSTGGASSGGSPGQLAAYHCNCALACLELGRYGDAINEGNAALVLTPPKHLAVKALYRLAVAYVNLKNAFEARRCLKKCLELDPMNEYVRAFLGRLGDEEEAVQNGAEGQLTWIEPPKRVQCLGAVAREKAKGKKAKQKANGTSADEPNGGCNNGAASSINGCNGGAGGKDVGSTVRPPEVRLDREAGLWHTMTRHNNKLYILGGWSDGVAAPGALGASASSTAGRIDTNNNNGHTNGNGTGVAMETREAHGSDELHVFDVDTFELRQLSGPNSKPPHPCYCHTATMVNTIMVVFGGCGPPSDQPALVMIFDVQQAKWRVPQTAGIPPRQRQGHTANAVQGDRQLCIFGGIEPTGEHRVARVYNDAHLLDLQSFSWRKLEVGGHRPPARFGHTATNLPGNSAKLLILGGRDHLGDSTGSAVSGGFTGLHILDTERRLWSQQAFSGTPPMQAFYHAASVIDDQTILYLTSGAIGGGTNGIGGAMCAAAAGQLPLHLLDLEAWHWSTPRSSGLGPAPHIGHTAALVGSRVYVFGGVVMREGHPMADKAVYVLDASQLRREQPPPERDSPQAAERSTNHTNNHSTAQATRSERGKAERAKSEVKAAAAAAAAAATSTPVVPAVPASMPVTVDECAESNRANTATRATGQVNVGPKPSVTEDKKETPRPAALAELSSTAASSAPPSSGAATVATASPATPTAPPRSDGTPVTRAAMRAAARAEATRTAGATGEKNNNSHGPEDRIQMMLRESDFDGDLDDATELSFEELLEQEKAYFKSQSEKPSFPRAKDHSSGKKGHKF